MQIGERKSDLGVRRGRNHRMVAACAALTAAAVLLTACSPSNAQEISNLILHPVGPSGAWVSEAYINGSSDSYDLVGQLCGVVDDIVIEISPDTGIVATSLTSQEVVWTRSGAMCMPAGVDSGVGLVVLAFPETASGLSETTWESLDPRNGTTKSALPLPAPQNIFGDFYAAMGVINDTQIFQSMTTIAGVRGDDVAWTRERGESEVMALLGDGTMGVGDTTTGKITLIDAATGNVTAETTAASTVWEWATDGVLVVIDDDPSTPTDVNRDKAEYQIIDLNGVEIDRAQTSERRSLVPTPGDRVTFSIEDHLAAPTVYGVSADGRPALFLDSKGGTFSQAGRVELPTDIGNLHTTSTDGSLLLFRAGSGAPVLVNAAGDTIDVGDVGDVESFLVMDGYIITNWYGTGTKILLPNAP